MNMETPTPESTQLVTIPEGSAYTVFTTETGIDPFLARVRQEIDAFVPDVSTATGRKAIASMAYVVTRTKTYLEEAGKALADEQKLIPKKIDAARKKMKDTLDLWRDEVRKPLTDWEAAEEARIKGHTDCLTALNEMARLAPGQSSAKVQEMLDAVLLVRVGPECEEFEEDYGRAVKSALEVLNAELPKAIQREKDAAELEILRADKAKRDEEARLQKIKDDAAAEATRIAQLQAQKLLDVEKEKTRQAEQSALAATQAAEAAAKKVADDAAAAVKAAADKKAAEDAETARREANKKHRATIHNAAVAAFIEGGMTEKAAKEAVTLIAMKKIPAVTITY